MGRHPATSTTTIQRFAWVRAFGVHSLPAFTRGRGRGRSDLGRPGPRPRERPRLLGRTLALGIAALGLCQALPGRGLAGEQTDASFPRFLRPLPGGASTTSGRSAAAFGRSLLLTFDDGPDLVGTSLILDELTRRGVKAVFFVNGHHIVRDRPEDLARRDLLRKLVTRGHLVGNHTMNHKNLCLERDVMAKEIDGASEIIAYATSVRPLLFRSPYGARCRDLDRTLADRDIIQVGWNMDPQEWRGEDEAAIVKYTSAALRRTRGPVILLLHDKNLAAVRALRGILDFVDSENVRAARDGTPPIRLVDYRVFLPAQALPETGLEPLGRAAVLSLGALSSLGSLF